MNEKRKKSTSISLENNALFDYSESIRLFLEKGDINPADFYRNLQPETIKKRLEQGYKSLFDSETKKTESENNHFSETNTVVELMSDEEVKNGCCNLKINYFSAETKFGEALIASTEKGICFLGFLSENTVPSNELNKLFPKATLGERTDQFIEAAISRMDCFNAEQTVHLHLKGTLFQLNVWKSLLQIPSGTLTTYSTIAKHIHQPKAVRAVGSAVGKNPVSFLVPCHRVIYSNGEIGNYHWGKDRKIAMIGYENLSQ